MKLFILFLLTLITIILSNLSKRNLKYYELHKCKKLPLDFSFKKNLDISSKNKEKKYYKQIFNNFLDRTSISYMRDEINYLKFRIVDMCSMKNADNKNYSGKYNTVTMGNVDYKPSEFKIIKEGKHSLQETKNNDLEMVFILNSKDDKENIRLSLFFKKHSDDIPLATDFFFKSLINAVSAKDSIPREIDFSDVTDSLTSNNILRYSIPFDTSVSKYCETQSTWLLALEAYPIKNLYYEFFSNSLKNKTIVDDSLRIRERAIKYDNIEISYSIKSNNLPNNKIFETAVPDCLKDLEDAIPTTYHFHVNDQIDNLIVYDSELARPRPEKCNFYESKLLDQIIIPAKNVTPNFNNTLKIISEAPLNITIPTNTIQSDPIIDINLLTPLSITTSVPLINITASPNTISSISQTSTDITTPSTDLNTIVPKTPAAFTFPPITSVSINNTNPNFTIGSETSPSIPPTDIPIPPNLTDVSILIPINSPQTVIDTHKILYQNSLNTKEKNSNIRNTTPNSTTYIDSSSIINVNAPFNNTDNINKIISQTPPDNNITPISTAFSKVETTQNITSLVYTNPFDNTTINFKPIIKPNHPHHFDIPSSNLTYSHPVMSLKNINKTHKIPKVYKNQKVVYNDDGFMMEETLIIGE